MALNANLKQVTNKILTKQLTPTKIYKSVCAGYYTIEIHSLNRLDSFCFKTELERDANYYYLEVKVFYTLAFNPYINC